MLKPRNSLDLIRTQPSIGVCMNIPTSVLQQVYSKASIGVVFT